MLRPRMSRPRRPVSPPIFSPLRPCAPAYFPSLPVAPVYLKEENLQRGGSFKLRGALNRLLTLLPEERERGVITASAGDHGQGCRHCRRYRRLSRDRGHAAECPARQGRGDTRVWCARGAPRRELRRRARASAPAGHPARRPRLCTSFRRPGCHGQGKAPWRWKCSPPSGPRRTRRACGRRRLDRGHGDRGERPTPPLRVYGVQAAGAAAAAAAFRSGRVQPTARTCTRLPTASP